MTSAPPLAHVTGRHGKFWIPPQDIYIGRSLALYGEWCPVETRLLTPLLRPGDIVIEVGANIGAHSLALARSVGPEGRVWAIEAQPGIHQILAANALQNDLPQLLALNRAAGAAEAVVDMPLVDVRAKGNFGGVSLDRLDLVPASLGTARVPVARLDDLIDPPSLRLIKLDVEGWEARVLTGARGLLQRFRPLLYVEADQADATQPILDAVAGLGYRGFWHVSPLFVPDNYRGASENVFPGVACVNMLMVPEGADVRGGRPVTGPESHPRLAAMQPAQSLDQRAEPGR